MPTDHRGYFTADPKSVSHAQSAPVPAATVEAVQGTASSPAPVAANQIAPIAVAVAAAPPAVQAVSHPALDKLFQILTLLEPLVLAGAAPFIKNPQTAAIIQEEAPVVEAITTALSGL